MAVQDQHPAYLKAAPTWQLVRDCDEGATAVKRRPSVNSGPMSGIQGTAYLPAPNAQDGSADNRSRYAAYRDRAVFVNYTAHTREGMIGLVFRKDTNMEDIDPAVEYVIENADGGGLMLDQLIKAVASDVLLMGRYGLLVDYPPSPEGLTEAQQSELYLRASIQQYPAESIINWRTEIVGGVRRLSLVVLLEPTDVSEPGSYEADVRDYYRVLRLVGGVYTVSLYDDDGVALYEDQIPKDSTGATWDEIPFQFVGALNNDEQIDKPPLADIAFLNIGHYRNSADYEESSFLVGQPTPVLSGLTQAWVESNFENGIYLGSRAAIPLPAGGGAMLLQAAPNLLPAEGMKTKEEQMVAIGAKIIHDGGGVETAEAARIRFAGQNSKLGSLIQNVESAINQALEWVGRYMGASGESWVTINRELYDARIDPQSLVAAMQLLDRRVLAREDLVYAARRAGVIDPTRTDDEILGAAEIAEL